MSQSIRDLSGKSWHEWPHTQLVEEMDALSPSPPTSASSTSATPTSSRSHSPKPMHESDACMRLPRQDMDIYGQCPVQEDYVLVVCDACHACVKIEAFASHVRLRHQKSRYNTKVCSVDLLKEDIFSLSTKPASSSSSSGASSVVAAAVAATASAHSSTPATPVIEVTAPPVPPPEHMEVVEDTKDGIKAEPLFELKSSTSPLQAASVIKEESNVISIPDTEPLPHGMSTDLMATLMGDSPMMDTSTPPLPPPPPAPVTTGMPVIRLQAKPEPSVNVAEVVIQHPLKKIGLSPIKMSSPATPSGTPTSGGRGDRKPLREYNPDKHCGVWDADTKRHCTRALTCKSHSVLLKRKIEGRSRTFDELVAAHKKAQAEAAAKAAPPVSSSIIRPFTPTVSVTAPPSVASIRTPPLSQVVTASTPLAVSGLTSPTGAMASPKDLHEESLYYTTDHPRPLAVCGFKGGRRVGGLIVTGRNHIFTRKLVRVAITAGTAASFGGGGFHRIRPRVFLGGGATVTSIESPQTSPYVLNYNLSGNIKRAGTMPVVGVTGNVSQGGNLNLTTLPPGGVVIPESFTTDIQDFKGGIKFELGRKIKHILPSGNEVSK
jgi:ataxin-7